MSDLITLTCPKCGGQLHTESTRMNVFCQFCGTEILIKDFITERRVDKEDKLSSYFALAENAVKIADYKTAYLYYVEICELEPSRINIMFLNLYGYYSAIMPFNFSIINDLYELPLNTHLQILNYILRVANIKKKAKKKALNQYRINPIKKIIELERIYSEYRRIANSVKGEIEKLTHTKSVTNSK